MNRLMYLLGEDIECQDREVGVISVRFKNPPQQERVTYIINYFPRANDFGLNMSAMVGTSERESLSISAKDTELSKVKEAVEQFLLRAATLD